jgi:threonine-phosphate decarboxylase
MRNGAIGARGTLAQLPKTVHGGQAWKLNDVEDYSHNLNPFGPPEDIGEIMMSAVGDVGHYPDDSCTELKSTISRTFGVSDHNVMIGAGSSDIIRNFPNTFLTPGDIVILGRPSFAEYAQQCKIVGAEIWWNDLREEDDFYMDRQKLTDGINDGAKAIYICNPNNPTGRVESKEKIVSIIEECSDNNVLVFLDETLLELIPNYNKVTCSRLVKEYDNLVVAGSLTKSFAIPGIRIGFGFASESLVSEMEKVRMTWNVGQVEQTVANVLIGERMDYVHKAALMMGAESKIMNRELNDIGFPAGNVSDSFFYFNSLRPLGVKCSRFKEIMLKNKVMVRDCSSFGSYFEWYVRYSVKDRERNEIFVKAVENSLKEMRS